MEISCDKEINIAQAGSGEFFSYTCHSYAVNCIKLGLKVLVSIGCGYTP